MPRRRPPGAGPGLRSTTALLAILLVLPWITTAAQQQQSPDNAHRKSPREEAYVDTITPQKASKPDIGRAGNASKRGLYTPLNSQNERAVATKVTSAPSQAGVRAPFSRNAAPSGGLTPKSARSLQDWEVEDFVLLATVDGRIHARDRYTGSNIWTLDFGTPMLEITYNQSDSDSEHNPRNEPFMWIVEPKEDGALYILTPGPHPVLSSLEMTVKQLAEELAPYSSEDPPVVYTAEKHNVLLVVDARTGAVTKSFSSGGSVVVDAESCVPQASAYFGSTERECRGFFNIGRTDYSIKIHNKITGDNICTIRYSEWTPNNRDRDLQAQYLATMDNQYIYSSFDGHAIAYDHNRPKRLAKRPVFQQKMSSPVVRVFDVARPQHDEHDPDPVLVLLPQPPGPAFVEDKARNVWLNTTESGSWYALSEIHYPAVTDRAPQAPCYNSEWTANDILNWAGPYHLPDRRGLVGVHVLDYQAPFQQHVPGIDAPNYDDEPKPIVPLGPTPEAQAIEEIEAIPATTEADKIDLLTDDISIDKVVDAESAKKVRFEIPVDDEDDLEPLSRTTTMEQASPNDDMDEPNMTANTSNTDVTLTGGDAQIGTNVTPTKKKKTHRGKRGGQKKVRKAKDDEEVDRIVNAAKELDQGPTLHPDEVAVNGDDVQDVSNVKKIGKLTIDFDRLLGNGSGGTFVFEGKWNEREVAVKRMLPQYFGLAEQEVKLLQESDLHPNVIRYFDDEKDENFLYIAVELCQASLFDLYRDGRPGDELSDCQQRLVNEINSDVPRALYQLALGVNHLHSLRIIHRDIKPQNILIAYPQRNQKTGPRLVISDFGLCKTLPDNVSTLIGTTGNAGTVGWKAPELILQPKDMDRGSSTGHSRDSSNSTDPVAQGVKRAVDIFSLGCVFFYVLTNGSHPFDDEEGWMQMRELNIKKNKANFDQLNLGDDSEEPRHLISWMLENRPEFRPAAIQVMNHPFFWPAEKRLNFLCDCSDHWEREIRDPPSDHLCTLERYSWEVLDKKRDFLSKLDRAFINSLGKQRKYTGDRMLDLLRAMRNKKNHYEDMDEAVKAKVGSLPQGYLQYWTIKFPKLIMSCYECVMECGLQGEPRFRPYFAGQTGV
ncbi:kinase-like protein [Lophiostoma macrostomum CBS 122681]|uniref:non-specific serine/threonine protein kinase n=1 Tax=Lophiostoma macrostomum CBS 122681 TaxID=1314788 RepID=A0A6A6TDH8_9PLEO|nr:kinase-like protein [Lophiostoma macrostomum CBS 122681]